MTGKIMVPYYMTDMEGIELPALSALVLPYLDSQLPMVVGVILAVISAIALGLANYKETFRSYLPILVALSMVVAMLHIATSWFASVLPLVKMGIVVTP
jgi:hypothetical protein